MKNSMKRSSDVEGKSDEDLAPPDVGSRGRQQLRPFIVLPISMFLCGVGNAVPDAATHVYTLSVLRVSPATQGALFGALLRLPWQFKIAAAFLSDAVPICGRRRLPYLMLALTLKAVVLSTIAAALPTVRALAALVFSSVVCQLFIGVTLDTIVVEQMAREEAGANFGRLQTHCWVAMTLGSLVGQLLGMVVLGEGPTGASSRPLVRACFAMGAVAQLANLGLVTLLSDPPVAGGGGCTAKSRRMVGEVVAAMRKKAVWWPCLFLFVQACHLRNSAAYDAFLLGSRHNPAGPQPLAWSSREFAAIHVVGACSNVLGAVCYRSRLKSAPLRIMFALLIIASSLISSSQLLLISGANRRMGIADFAFVVGDTAVGEVVRFLMSMPILTLQAAMCPAAATSTVFALVTSLQMAGATLGDSISALVTMVLGVTQSDFRKLGTLTMLGAASQWLALPLLFLVPNHAAYTARDGASSKRADGPEGQLDYRDDYSPAGLGGAEDDVGSDDEVVVAIRGHIEPYKPRGDDVREDDEATAESTPLLHAADHEDTWNSGFYSPRRPEREPLTGAIVLTTLLVLGTSFSVGECLVALATTKMD